MTNARPARNDGLQRTLAADASVHAQLQDWLQIEYAQIDAGEFEGQITRRRLGPVAFYQEYQNKSVLKRGHVPAHLCTISMVDQGHQAGWFMRPSTTLQRALR